MNYDVIYSRVSTDEQAKDGKTSIGEQIEGCKNLLSNQGLTNFKIFQEDFSGFEYDRPELDKIKELIADGKVRSFAVLRVDRLCRKVSVLEKLRDGYFKPLDIQVFSTDMGKWQWNPQQESLQEMLAVMASNWGKMAVETMQTGLRNHIKAGNVVCAGKAPLGFVEIVERNQSGQRIAGTLEINPIEAPIILTIFKNFVDNGMSLFEIAESLNADNVPTFSELRDNYSFRDYQENRSKSTHRWRRSTIRQILSNSVYDGRWKFRKTKTIKTMQDGKIIKKRTRDSSQAITVDVARMIPAEMWQQAQVILESNKRNKSGKPAKYEYLLRRRMTCFCGYKMNAYTRRKNDSYYRCKNPDCEFTAVRVSLVDSIAWQWLYKLLSDKNELRRKIDNYVDEQIKIIEPVRSKITLIESVLSRKEKEHEQMLSSYFRLPELAQAKAISQMESVETGIKELREEREALSKEIEAQAKSLEAVQAAINSFEEEKEIFGDAIMRNIGDVSIAQMIDLSGKNEIVVKMQTIPAKAFFTEEPTSFEDRSKYVDNFDLQVTILDKDRLFVRCKLDSEIVGLNCVLYGRGAPGCA